MLLVRLLERLVRFGELTLIDANGRTHQFRGPEIPGIEPSEIRLHDAGLHAKLAMRPTFYAGEAYMDGTLTVERGGLYNFLALMTANLSGVAGSGATWTERLFFPFRRLLQFNPQGRSKRNVAHHYDLSGQLYDLFLDADRQYSCAYFPDPTMSLEQAQQAKKLHIASKLLLGPGKKVLDIGCGWGGMALTLAQLTDAEVLGVTLSEEQLAVARRRAAEANRADHVRFELQDYRKLSGKFDRIVSVGMFEHVGLAHYPAFFEKARDLLTDDGVMLLHSIGRLDGPGVTNPWIRKYIFPGGYVPALSEVLPAIEKAGLFVTDVEILRLHYADTLREWRKRFQDNRDKVAEIYDERFCRMWEFYLAGSEVTFRHDSQMVFQIQLAKTLEAVPRTRDYMVEWEQAQRQAEVKQLRTA